MVKKTAVWRKTGVIGAELYAGGLVK